MDLETAHHHLIVGYQKPARRWDVAGLFSLYSFLAAAKNGDGISGGVVHAGRAGKLLLNAGDPSDDVYVLLSGCARTFVGETSSMHTTGLLKGPAIFGDRDILQGRRCRESVQLLTPARLLSIQRSDFLTEWESSVELRDWLGRDLASRFSMSLSWFDIETASRQQRVSAILQALRRSGIAPKDVAAALGLNERAIANADTMTDMLGDEPRELVHSLVDS